MARRACPHVRGDWLIRCNSFCCIKSLSPALLKTCYRDEISRLLTGLVAFLVMTFGNLLESSRGTQTEFRTATRSAADFLEIPLWQDALLHFTPQRTLVPVWY
jgi:hypothetical protein